jgi:hypothetical protein
MFKYGVVRMHDLVQDILNWERFYLSGRLQKPVCPPYQCFTKSFIFVSSFLCLERVHLKFIYFQKDINFLPNVFMMFLDIVSISATILPVYAIFENRSQSAIVIFSEELRTKF